MADDIRLTGGESYLSGRVEITHGGQFVTITTGSSIVPMQLTLFASN